MRRLLTLGSVLSLVTMVQPPAMGVVPGNASAMCQPTSTTPDVKETRRVQAVLVVGDTVYMGGRFDRVLPPGGGTAVVRNHLVACSLSTGAILPWNPDASGADALEGTVFALTTDGTTLYAGGAFDAVGGEQAIGLVALDPNPAVASPKPLLWGGRPGPGNFNSAAVKALALSDDRRTLYVGGNFSTFGFPGSRETRVGLAAVSTVDGTLSSWAPTLISETQQASCPPDDSTCVVEPIQMREVEVRGLAVRGDRVVAGGFFTERSLIDQLGSSYDGEGHVAAFHATTGAPVSWGYKPKYPVISLSADGDRVYVGGAGKGVSKNTLTGAGWADGSVKWTAYADGNWQAVWAGQGVVYGGGHMRRCGPKKDVQNAPEPTTQRLCAFDPATGTLLDWAPTTQSVGELGVFGLHGTADALVAVGEFSKINGADQRGAVRFGGPQAGTPAAPGNGPPGNAPQGQGYRLVATDGGIFSFGDARFFGSTGNIRLNQPIVGMTSTPSGQGYWLVASDGGIFSYGDARFFGSTGAIKLNRPIVGMSTTPSGGGYWLVASDGGIFAFGDARFQGSTGNIRLAKPITAMTATRSGNGYWMTATDGGIFAFGDARFFGSTGNQTLAKPIVAMSTSKTGNGYWMAGADGAIFSFGDAPSLGSLAGQPLAKPIVGMTSL